MALSRELIDDLLNAITFACLVLKCAHSIVARAIKLGACTKVFDDKPIVQDAARVFEVVRGGGVAIYPASVGYAIIGHEEEAVARMYKAKERNFNKPCGNIGDWQLFNEASDVPDRARDVVSAIIHEHDLPFSIVAPIRTDHPWIRSLPPFAFKNATKAGTMDILVNAGPLHDEIARLGRENEYAVVGSSANVSLTGSKFVLDDIQDQVIEAADIAIDYGLVPYHNDQGPGSTIVDLISFETIRVGAVYDKICNIVREQFDIDLKGIMAAMQ